MRKIFSRSKPKPPTDAAASSSSSNPGYQLKEKDLPKLHKAAWNGDLTKFTQLSKKGDVYALDKQNRTPLHLACAQGHLNIVDYLASNTQASKLNLCDNDQRSALMKAVQGNHYDCAEKLLDIRADPNLVDRDGNTALHLAANYGFVDVAILLLNNGAMATPTNKTGSTPLHLATSGKHDEMVEILLEGNADVNATDNDNRTALMLACQTDQIGMVKMLLDNKAETDIKDSKGWTANDHAIMGGFHGCSHLIDEFNASRRPKPVSRPSSAGLFGSTTGSDALGFSLGGPAVDNFDDDGDDLSFEKGSAADSWNASASEAEELPKHKPKVMPPVNLGKLVKDSDNESVKSGVSMRSSASRSRIPRSVSRQGSITSERSLQSARGSTSGSKLPRPASTGSKKPGGKPSKTQEPTQGRSNRRDSWGSTPRTPVGSAPPTPSGKGVTPRESGIPTPRGSILSALDTGSEWDDDDVLDALEDTGTAPKQLKKVSEQKENTPEKGKGMSRGASAANQQRKEVLQGLGMSDVDDESSVAFSDEESQGVGTVKRNVRASGDYPDANEQNNNNKDGQDQMPPPEEEDDEDDGSDWDSDGDDLLPSETDNKGPPVIRLGALSRGNESEDNASLPPSPGPPSHVEEDSPPARRQLTDEPQVRSHVSKMEESPVHKRRPGDQTDSPRRGEGSKDKQGKEDDDDAAWDSEDEDLEEESEWERERSRKRESLGEELQISGQLEELNRQNQWEEEEKQQREKQRQEAAEELRREREEQEQERRQQEAAEDRRRREEEEAEVERKRSEIEEERQRLEEVRRQEEERIQAERERLEEERVREQERRDAEQRQLEAERKREKDLLEEERRRLEEEKRQTALQRDAEHRKREQALREEEKRIEAEKRRLEEQRQQEEARLEEARRLEELRKKEIKNQESEKRRLDEERRQMEEHRRRIDEEKKQLEQERRLEMERKKMDDERRKREEDRLEAERKRHEEMRQQFESDQLKMTQELKDEDEIRRAMERKHLEDERQRLEEQRLETERREREMEEQRMQEKQQLLSTQKEMEEMRRRMEEERARYEQQLRENADRRAVESEKEQFEEAKKQEQDRLLAEKERLQAENEEIEKKRLEIQALQKQLEKKDPERTLLRYQESIEKRLADEDRSVQSVNGMDEDNESLEDITRDLEAAEAQRRQIESDTYSANPGHTPREKANTPGGMQSLANTGDFSVASFSQGNPLSSTRVPPGSRQSPVIAPTNTTSPVKALYNSPMQRSSTGPTNTVPTWQTVLSEPDGLDYTSSEGEEDMMATQDGLRSSLRSPYLASTPARAALGSPSPQISPSSNDPTAILRLQSMVREQKRATERERNERLNADNESKILQGEKAELQKRLDEVTKFKTSLDQQLLDLEAKIRGLEHELSQELERRHNSEVLLQKTKEQLLRKEELYAAEIEAKQRTELASRNVQMDLRSSQNMIKQLEEERNELRRQLNQEKAARAIQEEMVSEHRRSQEALQEETTKVYTEKAEAVSRLEAADESRKAAMNHSDKLKTELHAFKMELEKQKMRHRDDQGLLVSENEELTGKIEELKNEMRVNEEALAHATMTYNAQLAAVRTENGMLHNSVEKEKHAKDQFKAELGSVQKRLDTTNKELEKAEKARSELEHTLQRECDEWSRARERLEHENASMKESSQAAAQRLGAAESRVASLEHELQAANTSLMERSNQLTGLQRDLDLRSTMQNSHDSLLHKQREENVKLLAKVETLSERLSEAQTEIGSLKRALDAAQHHSVTKDKDNQNAQDKFNNTLTSLQAENDRTRTIWEERNNALQESVSRLKEELQRAEHNSIMKDQDLRKLQQELTDSLLKVSITENHLEMARKAKGDLERDKSSGKDHIKQLTDKISSLEKERHSLDSRVDELQSQLVQAERSNLDTSHQLMATQTTLQHKADLEAEIRQLEKENSRLEMSLQQETNRSGDLARKLDDAQQMCSGYESMITNIKTSQLVMEDKLSEATAAKSLFAREVDDHKQLWETEVKSRSKLGLRIAQLERAKTEIQAQVDEEKKKTRKMAELKRSVEEKWQNETQRTQQLEQENATLRAKIKVAKKKLKDQGPPELRLSTMQTEFERERLNMEAAMATLRRQLEDVNQQLDRESMLRMSVEKANRQLQQDINASKTSEKTKDKLERSKRRLEDELAQMKLAVENGYIEKGHLEKYKQELDAKARLEINEKLEQVNSYLEEQSQAREKLEQLRLANEAEVRKELEDTIDDLKFQLSRVRNGYHDAQTRKDTMEAETSKFKEMYNHEVQRREKLSSDLEKTQDKLLEAQAKLNFERQRNRQIREGSLSMAADTPAGVTPAKTSNAPSGDSIAEKVWSELDKSITRHLQAAPTDTGPNLPEFSLDRLNNSYGATSPRAQENSYLATLRKNYFV